MLINANWALQVGTEGRMKSHNVCRVCSCHHVISNWHFIPGGFCLTTSAGGDQFSELSTLSCQKNVLDNDVANFFLIF